MSNIHGIRSPPVKKPAELEQAGSTSGTATIRPVGSSPLDALVAAAKNQAASLRANEFPQEQAPFRLTLYANGFLFDEEFFDVKDPSNRALVEEMKEGSVPHELERRMMAKDRAAGIKRTSNVPVELVDKTQETYVPPKPKFSFEKSQGQSLSVQKVVVQADWLKGLKGKAVEVDEKENTTTIQFILLDKSKVKQKFNPERHTVLDLFQHVAFVSKVLGSFELISGFPPKPLTDPNLTIKAAGLAGASITQKQ